jgi:predicted acylesterase/phospholipase RssA
MPTERPRDLIFNGTGINYSWHFPRLFEMGTEEVPDYHSITCVSGGATAFFVYWAVKNGLAKWSREHFLDWNKLTHAVYGNNLLSGSYRFLKLVMRSRSPVYSPEVYKAAWAMAARSEFFDIEMRDIPRNVRIPLLKRSSGEIVIASAESEFAYVPAYLVSFAATAIPGIFPEIVINGEVYGDITYSKKFLPWLKRFEAQSESFENYNLMKSAEYPNGRYIKICEHPEPKKMMRADNLKFLFGRHIASYPENVRRSKIE